MPRFVYSARNRGGELQQGHMDAPTAAAVADQLAASGVIPLTIEREDTQARSGRDGLTLPWQKRVALDDLILFSRQMYTLVRSGVPMIRALRGLTETTRNKTLAKAIDDVRDNLESGRDLSSSLAARSDVFPLLFSSLVQVGEGTGRMDEAFLRLSQYMERDRDTRKQVSSALRYPALVLIAVCVAIGVLSLFVIPKFAVMFKRSGVDLPLPTRIILGISDFAVAYWPVVLLSGVVLSVMAVRYVNTPKGRLQWDTLKLRVPLAGNIVLRATLARFCRAFAMGYASGVPLVQALGLAAKAIGNSAIERTMVTFQGGIERGDTLTRSAHATGVFTPLVLQMLAVGEESGAVDEMLNEVAGYYEREVEYDLRNLSVLIEPIMIAIMGVMVLILALGVFLPMWNMMSVLKH